VKKMKKLFSLLLVLLVISFPVSASASGVPVLLYHNVTEGPTENDALMHISTGMLEEHFKALADNGYTAVSMSEYYDWRTKGIPLPKKCVLITFDDGYISNYQYAYPLLKKYNLKATIYVIASRMGAANVEFPHFSWQQAIEMEKSGYVEIESHSFTHPDFSTISYEQTVIEMRLSKYAIETNMNKECRFFAYPYGKTNSSSAAVAAQAPYKMVSIVSNSGIAGSGTDFYNLPRHTVSGKMTGAELIEYLNNIN